MTQPRVDLSVSNVARHVHTRAFWRGLAQGATSPRARAGFTRNFRSAALVGALGSILAFRRAHDVAALQHHHLSTATELSVCFVGSFGAVALLRALEYGQRRWRAFRAA